MVHVPPFIVHIHFMVNHITRCAHICHQIEDYVLETQITKERLRRGRGKWYLPSNIKWSPTTFISLSDKLKHIIRSQFLKAFHYLSQHSSKDFDEDAVGVDEEVLMQFYFDVESLFLGLHCSFLF